MAAIGKHFPGHGWVRADSHLEIPQDERPFEAIESADYRVFSALIHQLGGIMPAHVIYSEIDQSPAGFSHEWITAKLRGSLNYTGVVFSDDLSMEGASVAGGYPERAEAALRVGCDMILVCNNREAAWEVAHWLDDQQAGVCPGLSEMRGKGKTPDRADITCSSQWQETVAALKKVHEAF
jgi:beta-N-acetylhexosaminidase